MRVGKFLAIGGFQTVTHSSVMNTLAHCGERLMLYNKSESLRAI